VRITKRIVTVIFLSLLATPSIVVADEEKSATQIGYIRQEIQRIIDVNEKYKENFHDHISAEMLQNQAPDATVLMCSDSRIDTASFSEEPAGSLFVIRNIGNQVSTAPGSIEYGVDYLHTPIVIVIGHSGCGAIKAAMGDYRGKSPSLKAELITLELDPKTTLNKNIVKNVNNQVAKAVADFKSKVVSDQLLVVGMVYDLHNDFKYGYGKMIVVNINNVTDPKMLANNIYIKDLKHLAVFGLTP
jgi:carbonic anhydrase